MDDDNKSKRGMCAVHQELFLVYPRISCLTFTTTLGSRPGYGPHFIDENEVQRGVKNLV